MYLLNDKNCDIIDRVKEKCHGEIVTAVHMKWVKGAGRKPVLWQTLVDVLRDIQLNFWLRK